MAHRHTLKELLSLTARISNYADTLGIIDQSRGERIGLDEGSATYGRAFRLFSTGKDGHTGHGDPFHLGSGFLGMTKSEAWLSLRALEAGLWASIIGTEKALKKAEAEAEARAQAQATSHGKPAEAMREALDRLGEIVEALDLDEPLRF